MIREIVFLALGVGILNDQASAVIVDRLEASVNNSLILLSDVRDFRRLFKLRAQVDPLFTGTTLASEGVRATSAEIVEYLINQRLILEQFPVTDQEVEQKIKGIQSDLRLDREGLKAALTQQGFTFDDYFELTRSSASAVNLIDRDIRTKVSISDDDVKNYFFNHYTKQSSVPLAYRLRIITISIKNYKTTSAAYDIAQQALHEIKGGEAFEEVAKRLSDDATAQSGGDLGTLTEDQMSGLIKEKAKKLQIGQISDVFGGPGTGAYLVLKLVDVKSNDSEQLEKEKEEIRNQLTTQEYQHQISLWLERQRQTAFIHKAGEPITAGLPIINQ